MKNKKIKILFMIVVLVIVVMAVCIFTVIKQNGKKTDETIQTVDLDSYEGGFAGWEKENFKGSVKTQITIPYPLMNTDRNNYAVYIGAGKINTGVIMQENQTAVAEWSWLINAQPDMQTQEYYFDCTLTYTGQKAGESQMPIFVIENPVSVNTDNVKEQKETSRIDLAEYVGKSIDGLKQTYPGLNYDEIFYYDETGNVTVDVDDAGNSDMAEISGDTHGRMEFAGISVGDNAEEVSDDGLIDIGYKFQSSTENQVLYLYSDNMAGVMITIDENNNITDILWMDNYGEMTDNVSENKKTDQTETYDLDYSSVYGGIIDKVIGELDPDMDSNELQYAFYDIDKDGYLEFLIENGNLEYEVWTTTGEGCSYVGAIWGLPNIGLYECKNKNGIYTDYCNMGYETITKFRDEEGVLTEEQIYEDEAIDYGYDKNGDPFDELAFPIQTHTLEEGIIW